MDTLTQSIARFACGFGTRPVPAASIAMVREAFTDLLGVMLAGGPEPVARILTEATTGREVARGKTGAVFLDKVTKKVALLPEGFKQKLAASFNLCPEWLGQEFLMNGSKFVVVGLKPEKHKNIVLIRRVSTGKHFVAVGARGHILTSTDAKAWKQVAAPVDALLTSVKPAYERLIATMTALVLGLITASAKNDFDEAAASIKTSAASISSATARSTSPSAAPWIFSRRAACRARPLSTTRLATRPASPSIPPSSSR